MKILLGFSYYPYPVDVQDSVNAWLARLGAATGVRIDSFCLTLNPPGPRLGWNELDARWKRGDPNLLNMYERLTRTLRDYDVFINWNGINLHPEFVNKLPVFRVFGCFDDPESTEDLSRPVAWAYDLCLVGNIAELDTYRGWGIKQVRHWPHTFRQEDCDSTLTRECILNGSRDNDIALICERTSPWRNERLDRLVKAFPDGAYYGHGWPNGFLPESQRVPLLQRTKIGINIHNSTGPINYRTYYLPANGVMQICDNKAHLGKIFELNKEVVGFETIDEAIDLCQYYLVHDEERRQIAAAGWERAMKDYNEIVVFNKVLGNICEVWDGKRKRGNFPILYLKARKSRFLNRRIIGGLCWRWNRLMGAENRI
jgi:spore maturation protein CgeB